MKQNKLIDGDLEIDFNNGIITFHSMDGGWVALRISGLDISKLKHAPRKNNSINIIINFEKCDVQYTKRRGKRKE